MKYEKLYKEALERASKLRTQTVQNPFDTVEQMVEYIFPELIKSKDEIIREALINFIKYESDFYGIKTWCHEYTTEEVISWLEKQCDNKKSDDEWEVSTGLYKCTKQMFDGTPEGRLLFEIGKLYKCISKNDIAEFESSYGHSVFLIDPVVRKHFIKVKDTTEKQDEDERIRNKIMTTQNLENMTQTKDDLIKEQLCDFIRDNMLHQDAQYFISWLEKQSKKKSADEVLKIRQELYQSGYNDGYKHGYNHGQNNIAIALKKESIEALEHFVRSIGESGYASPYDNRTKLVYTLLEQLKQIVK